MKIALQFAMPAEFHALPGARDLQPIDTISGVPFYEAAPGIVACAGGISKVNESKAVHHGFFCVFIFLMHYCKKIFLYRKPGEESRFLKNVRNLFKRVKNFTFLRFQKSCRQS